MLLTADEPTEALMAFLSKRAGVLARGIFEVHTTYAIRYVTTFIRCFVFFCLGLYCYAWCCPVLFCDAVLYCTALHCTVLPSHCTIEGCQEVNRAPSLDSISLLRQRQVSVDEIVRRKVVSRLLMK